MLIHRPFGGHLIYAIFVKGPDELRHAVRFPEYLDDVPNNLQAYGEISSYSPAIFYKAVGWYDNDAANLTPIGPKDEAQRMVPLLGGREKVLAVVIPPTTLVQDHM